MARKLKPAALATLVLLSGLAAGAMAQERKTYIVQLKDEPVASYQGGVAGLAATQPAPGTPLRYSTAAVQAYVSYLGQQQDTVIAVVGNAPVLARYDAVFNGFAAQLTDDEVRALRGTAGVVDIFEDLPRQMDTISTSKFLGLTAPGGLWSQSAGGAALKGEDIVIGIVDGGIWPENPAYADRTDANGVPTFDASAALAYGAAPAFFKGGCVPGEGFDPAKHCNNKLIGAKFYNAGFLAQRLPKNWSEFYSPRDSVGGNLAHGGHGTHTSTTAAGNARVAVTMNGSALGDASGMAPRARIASYKVCWTYDDATATDGTGSRNSCWPSDSVAAIDQAVKDGVNAINYSISGSQTSVNDPVEQAFYRASLAGVFVAASAGNSGPANQVAHISPWITTVANAQHDRILVGDVTLGNGAKYTGAALNESALPATALIRAEDAALPGVNPALVSLCFAAVDNGGTPVLDPAKVAGKVVVCTRGTNARVNKSLAVAEAGGLGMVMKDNGAGLVAEKHAVPTVHVSQADGAAIQAYAAAGNGNAALSKFYLGSKPAPILYSGSSRGPNQGDANVLKPDLAAPGTDVIAGVAAPLTPAQRDAVADGSLVPPPDWASYTGTSMSSPHVAGLSLLLKQARPTWSPAAIKSALMTTAYATLNDGLSGAQAGTLPWGQGAGHVDPNKAVDPGLVYDAGKADYVAYQCKVNRPAMSAADCATYGTLNETYNLNLPSITVGNVVSSVPVTVTRRVTNVGASTATYTATAAVPGFGVTVTPSTLTLAPGETKSFTVRLAAAGAAANVWQFGTLSWTDGSHVVRSPIQARVGKAVEAPAQLSATTASGSKLLTVKTGFSGRLGSAVGGLSDATLGATVSLVPGAMDDADFKAACAAGQDRPNVKVYPIVVPANTLVLRAALRQSDVSDPADDHDLVVVAPDGSSVYSGTAISNESVQIGAPAPGTYKVCVLAYGGGATMTHRLSSWVVKVGDTGGNFRTMMPSQVYPGSTATVGLSWSGLAPGGRYMGGVQFRDASGIPSATTVVRVETNGGLPLSEPGDVASAKLRVRAD